LNKLFAHFVVPFIKVAKWREIIVTYVSSDKLYLTIDDEQVIIQTRNNEPIKE